MKKKYLVVLDSRQEIESQIVGMYNSKKEARQAIKSLNEQPNKIVKTYSIVKRIK